VLPSFLVPTVLSPYFSRTPCRVTVFRVFPLRKNSHLGQYGEFPPPRPYGVWSFSPLRPPFSLLENQCPFRQEKVSSKGVFPSPMCSLHLKPVNYQLSYVLGPLLIRKVSLFRPGIGPLLPRYAFQEVGTGCPVPF